MGLQILDKYYIMPETGAVDGYFDAITAIILEFFPISTAQF